MCVFRIDNFAPPFGFGFFRLYNCPIFFIQ